MYATFILFLFTQNEYFYIFFFRRQKEVKAEKGGGEELGVVPPQKGM